MSITKFPKAIREHENFTKPYGIVFRELTTKQPWINHEKHKEFPKRTSKKDRRILKTV